MKRNVSLREYLGLLFYREPKEDNIENTANKTENKYSCGCCGECGCSECHCK